MKRMVIGGKVLRTPEYDDRALPAEPISSAVGYLHDTPAQFKVGLYRDADHATRVRDKALLVSLGVDGDVPFNQAMTNAGLDHITSRRSGGIVFRHAANDNNKIAAKAA